MNEQKDKITAAMRRCLAKRDDDLQHLLSVGIDNADWYQNAYECLVLFNSIDENERTPDEVSKRKRLLELTGMYEDEHYGHGN